MTDDRTRRVVAEALARLESRLRAPRALAVGADERAELEAAIERTRGQWLGPSEPVLTVALAGGTGAGKSTLINALAGTRIAEVSEIRPTTRHLQVYHHHEDALGTLTEDLASEAAFVAHDRPELRHKMLVDAPDLDSFVVRHRATTKALLRRAGLVLYVFSPERYLEERTWSILRKETEFSACAAVLNKVDRVGSAEELEQITEDLRGHFAALGLGDIRIFRVCARAHVPDRAGALPELSPVVDDMVALRAYIERELHGSEIARLLRAQKEVVVAHLRAEVDRVAPEAALGRVEQVAREAAALADDASARLAGTVAEPLAAVEAELAPLVTLRRHERFWGPFRVWLSLGDFVNFGLATLIRRALGRPAGDRTTLIARTLERGGAFPLADALRDVARAIQDRLYALGLPIERWREIAATIDGPGLVSEVAREIEVGFDVQTARISEGGRRVVSAVSTLGGLVPSAFVLIGLAIMTRDLVAGRYGGLPLLWHLLAMLVLFFLALQGLVGVLLPGGTRWFGASIGPHAIRAVVTRVVGAWVAAYRAELESDVAELREPLDVLVGCLPGEATTPPASVQPRARESA